MAVSFPALASQAPGFSLRSSQPPWSPAAHSLPEHLSMFQVVTSWSRRLAHPPHRTQSLPPPTSWAPLLLTLGFHNSFSADGFHCATPAHSQTNWARRQVSFHKCLWSWVRRHGLTSVTSLLLFIICPTQEGKFYVTRELVLYTSTSLMSRDVLPQNYNHKPHSAVLSTWIVAPPNSDEL